MPAYADQITLGEGKFRARLTIEGWPEIFVSDSSLVRTTSDSRSQILGLDPQTIRVAASADLMRAELQESEQTIEIVDDSEVVGGKVIASGSVTAALSKAPTNTTFLNADLAVAATTATVTDTTAFASSGVIHIGTEAIKYTGKTSTTFTGLTRGHWDTTDQKHFVGDGERLAFPKVTNRPRTLRGRRARVYLYGLGDSDTSDGTLRWKGICRTDSSYTAGRYAFGIEPRSWIFEQPIGGDLEDPMPIRGILLPSEAALRFRIKRLSGGNATDGGTADKADVVLSGFWKDQEAFVVALNAVIATAVSGWTWDADTIFEAQSDGPDGWTLVYRNGDTNARYIAVVLTAVTIGGPKGASPIDLVETDSTGIYATWFDQITRAPTETVATGQLYTMRFRAPTPRAVLTGSVTTLGPDSINLYFRDLGGTMETGRVYIGGNFVPSTDMFASIRAHPDDEESPLSYVASVNAAGRYVVVTARSPQILGPLTTIRFGRTLARGTTMAGFLVELTIDSPATVNAGAMPLLTNDDIDIVLTEIANAARGLRLATRNWITTEGVSLGEILTHEARLIGVYPAPDANGEITWRRLRPALATDVGAITLDAASITGAMPSIARNNSGNLREVVYRQGWDPFEGEHRGLTIRVRDVQGVDPTPLGGVLEIAPRSTATDAGAFGLEIDPLDAELLGHSVLGMFGGGYRVGNLEASLIHFAANLGDVAVVTTPLLPDTDGTMGLTSKAAIITGYDWSPFEGHGTLTLRFDDRNIGGYSPSVLVASQVDNTGDNWTITVTLTGYTSSSDISDWFAVGDEVRVIERNSASPTTVVGDVTALDTATSLSVGFDATWTPGASTWYLAYDTTANVDETAPSGRRWDQTKFAKIGGADQKAALGSGDVESQDLV